MINDRPIMKLASLAILALAVYIAAVVETSLPAALEVHHVVPDLFALAAIVWQLTAGGSRGFVIAAAIGLAYDLTSNGPLGLGMGLFALAGYGIALIRVRLDLHHLALRLTVVAAATALVALGEAAVWHVLGETTLPWTTLAVRAATVGVYTTAISLPLLMLIGWLPSLSLDSFTKQPS